MRAETGRRGKRCPPGESSVTGLGHGEKGWTWTSVQPVDQVWGEREGSDDAESWLEPMGGWRHPQHTAGASRGVRAGVAPRTGQGQWDTRGLSLGICFSVLPGQASLLGRGLKAVSSLSVV